jgi:3',5'-cyclic-nucleotide phosphodiesterase
MAMLFAPGLADKSMSESIIAHNIASSMAVPLLGAHGALGVMQVDNRATEEPFGEADLDLMVVLASGAAAALERAQFQDEIRRTFEGFVEASVTAIESRDPTTSGHSRRVADYSLALARAVSRTRWGARDAGALDERALTELSYAALLHDFGKVGVPECVLRKARRLHPEQLSAIRTRFREIRALYHRRCLEQAVRESDGSNAAQLLERVSARLQRASRELDRTLRLVEQVNRHGPRRAEAVRRLRALAQRSFTDADGQRRHLLADEELEALCIRRGTLTPAERRTIESHVVESQRFLEQIPWSSDLARIPEIVAAHHEKLDGSGYPRGLRAEQIPLQARLLAVCDIFDALTASDRPYRSAVSCERGLEMLRRHVRAGQIDAALVEVFIEARVWQACARPRS